MSPDDPTAQDAPPAEDPELTPLQAAVLARTPAAARRMRYEGEACEVFRQRCSSRNPHVTFEGPEPLDALALDDATLLLDHPGLAAGLAPAGVLVAGLPAGPAERLAALIAALDDAGLEALGLFPLTEDPDAFDDHATNRLGAWRAGTLHPTAASEALVVTARPTAAGAPPPLHLLLSAFAVTLMDIRTRLPAHALRTEPTLICTYRKPPIILPRLPVDAPKVHVMQRPALRDPDQWRQLMRTMIKAGWIVVMEYDDHPDLVAEALNRTPGEADWLRYGYVHGVQTSTPALARQFGAYNREVRVFANAVFELAPFPPSPAPRRVFYGAVSRGAFAQQVARSLASATAEFPDVEFVVVGDRAVFDALPTTSKRFHDYLPYDDYLRTMGDCAISLSPIEGRRHQDTKSDAKFLDAASRGVLTIASPPIYAEVIRHGENGLIAREVADWAPLLAQALRDEADRRRMARAAWEEVRDVRMFADRIGERRDWYRSLWERREALNAAVASRLPGLAEALAASP